MNCVLEMDRFVQNIFWHIFSGGSEHKCHFRRKFQKLLISNQIYKARMIFNSMIIAVSSDQNREKMKFSEDKYDFTFFYQKIQVSDF